jgi:phosphohistidine phosphatase
MMIYLFRHGLAIDREDPECPPDPKRFLTRKGVEKTRAAAMGLRALGLATEMILSSPYVRAMQTAELAAEALEFPRARITQTDALLPPAHPAQLMKVLANTKASAVLCVGHAPNLDEVIAYALGAQASFTALKKAGAAGLEMESLSPGKGTLLWLHTPKSLRLLAG